MSDSNYAKAEAACAQDMAMREATKGRQDPDFMRWMHDRLLRPPFVSAASVWDAFVKQHEASP